jgi:hypothetical protein
MSDLKKHQELINTLMKHKNFLTTVKQWDVYAKKNGLPLSSTLIKRFDSWNNLKEILGAEIKRKKRNYTKEDLLEIAKKHNRYFQSKGVWDSYARENDLPSSFTFINVFGSWNTIKELIGFEGKQKRKRDIYSKEQLLKILNEHGHQIKNRKQWDDYAKEHNLPTYKTLRKHFSWEEILSLAKKEKTFNLSKNELIQIALKHFEPFIYLSMDKWDEYAKERGLPSSMVYYRRFKGWKKAKNEVLKIKNEHKQT